MKGIESFEAFLKEIGMPLSFDELGVPESDIDKMVESIYNSRGTLGVYVKMGTDEMKEVYEIAKK